MKTIVAAIALLVLAAAPAAAQESHRALAERAVAVAYEPQIADRIMEVFWPAAEQAIRERVPEVNALQLFQYENDTMALVDVAAHKGLAPLVEYFERAYSDAELQTIIAFYESTAGMKLSNGQGTIAQVLQGRAGQTLNAEVDGLRAQLDAMLKADGL